MSAQQLDTRVTELEREMREIRAEMAGVAKIHEYRHVENSGRLSAIEKTLTGIASLAAGEEARHAERGLRLGAIEKTLIEIGVYLKVGRWVITAAWAVGSAVATALAMKWLGAKT